MWFKFPKNHVTGCLDNIEQLFGGSVENAECGVWKMRSVENAGCGKCRVWKMRGVENAECGKCGVWKMWGVENAECGK